MLCASASALPITREGKCRHRMAAQSLDGGPTSAAKTASSPLLGSFMTSESAAHLGNAESMAQVQHSIHVGVGEVAKKLPLGVLVTCQQPPVLIIV